MDRQDSLRQRTCWMPAALVAMSLLSGCSGFLATRQQHAQGWRHAHVLQIGKDVSVDQSWGKDCRASPSPSAGADGSYVVYQFMVGSSRYRWVAPLLPGSTLKVGDQVRVNIEDCEQPPVPDPH